MINTTLIGKPQRERHLRTYCRRWVL